MWELDTMAPDFASMTGTGQMWDYSTTAGLSETTRAVTVEAPGDTPEGGSFPAASKAVVIDGFMTTYISSSASSRNSQGFSFEAGGIIGTVNAVLDVNDEVLMNYPMALTNSLMDDFEGSAETAMGDFPCTGNNMAIVDGEGTLKLNAATTVNNVLRYKLVDTAHANTGILGNVDMIRTQYEYYALGSNSNLPLFIHTKLQIVLGGAPTETVYALSYVEPDGYLSTSSNELAHVSVYPNPAEDMIAVKGLKHNATLSIVDAQGKTLSVTETEPGIASIDVAQLNAGIYFLHIASNNETTVQRVVIR